MPYVAGGPRAYEKYMERQAKAGPDGVYREKTDKTVKSAFWDDMIALLLGLMIIAAVGYAALHYGEKRLPNRQEV